jgi:hypothetical protein
VLRHTIASPFIVAARRARSAAALALFGMAQACGSGADAAPAFAEPPSDAARLQPATDPATERGGAGAPSAPDLLGPAYEPASDDAVCVATRAEAEVVAEPVDIVVLLDNSLSMIDEAKSMEANLNDNFAAILAQSGIDYRVILISNHRDTDNLLGATSVCISGPLSAGGPCPTQQPVFGERFFHYSVDVGSHDSLTLLLDTYAGQRRDDYGIAPGGWSQWLRPGAEKVFLELTDDDSLLPADVFLSSLTSAAPHQFGTDPLQPTLVWHSIVGIGEKAAPADAYQPSEPVELRRCSGNLNSVFNAGATYQELSRRTGGLRFPICQFGAYDVVFRTIAEAVISTTRVACSFAVPDPPAGTTLELDKVAVSYAPGAGGPGQVFGQVTDAAACQSDTFLAEPSRITLCPAACDVIRADPGGAVDVLFTCESTVVVR